MPYAKRIFDLFVVVVTTPVWLPVVMVIAVLAGCWLGRPILFQQKRPGYKGKIFELLKFRTMTDTQDDSGKLLPDKERLTPFGRWLRSTSLDELPELLNVLKGEMSLVGPRPLLVQYLDRYSPEQMRRHDTLPGLTGWCQVNGRNSLPWEEKLRLDVWYVDHWSLWLDIKILAMTVVKVMKREGISAAGEATMPEFMGKRGERSEETKSDAS